MKRYFDFTIDALRDNYCEDMQQPQEKKEELLPGFGTVMAVALFVSVILLVGAQLAIRYGVYKP